MSNLTSRLYEAIFCCAMRNAWDERIGKWKGTGKGRTIPHDLTGFICRNISLMRTRDTDENERYG